MCGGLVTDENGMTNISNLYAIGEVACTGLHGANRLASNSLLEALVFARKAAIRAKHDLENNRDIPFSKAPLWEKGVAIDSEEMVVVTHNWDEIRRLMWNYVGIVRTNRRLARARARIENIQSEIREYYWNFTVTRDLLELRNSALDGELIVTMCYTQKSEQGAPITTWTALKRMYENWRLRDTVIWKLRPAGQRMRVLKS
jgi:L-aspartate oxidase